MGLIKASSIIQSLICSSVSVASLSICYLAGVQDDHVDDQFTETIYRIVLFSKYSVKQKISQVVSNVLFTLFNRLIFSPCIQITLWRSVEIVVFGSFENYLHRISVLLRQREASVDCDKSRTSRFTLMLFVHIIPSSQRIIPSHQNSLQRPIKVNNLITKHHTVLWKM